MVGTNPVPVKVTTGEVAPTSTLDGEKEETAGAGLSTSRLAGVLPVLPLATTTARLPPLVNWLAGTVAVSLLALEYVVASEAPPTNTVLLLANPEPETVTVVALDPAGTLSGLTDVMTGVELLLPPPEPEPLPEPEPPLPPQPMVS